MGWETQPLPCAVARCGLTNPQHRGIIPCFLKQVLRARFIEAINLSSTRLGKEGAKWINEAKADFNLFFDLLDDEASFSEAASARINHDVAKAPAEGAAPDFSWLESDENREITAGMRDELRQHLSSFISDEHRAFIVRCHARGFSTSDAVKELIKTDETLKRLSQMHVLGEPQLRTFLIPRLAYLKPGSSRWPEAKYGATWREAREAHKQTLRDIRFTSQEEQAALLAKQVDRINNELERGGHSLVEMQLLTNMLIKTVESLRKLSAVDEQQIPVNLSAPQLVGGSGTVDTCVEGTRAECHWRGGSGTGWCSGTLNACVEGT